MRLGITADLHLSAYRNDSIVPESGLPEKLHEIIQTLNNMVAECIKRGIDTISFAGDIFHDKSIIHSIAQNVFLDFIRSNRSINFIIIDGNHDMASMSKEVKISALKCCDMEPNVTMIHETTIIENIAFVPWGKTMIEDVKTSECDYLISHFGVNEAELSSGLSLVADIKMTDLKKYKKVVLGFYDSP